MPPEKKEEEKLGVVDKLRFIREKRYASRMAEGFGIKAVAGKQWGFHYPKNGETRDAILRKLFRGKGDPDKVADDLKPDALMYNQEDFAQENGQDIVVSRIKDAADMVKHYDYKRYARFIKSMKGNDVDLHDLTELYQGIAQTRTRRRVFEAAGDHAGRGYVQNAVFNEVSHAHKNFGILTQLQQVIAGLKANFWAEQGFPGCTHQLANDMISKFSPEQQALYDNLAKNFNDFAKTDDETAFDEMTEKVKEFLPDLKDEEPEEEDEETKNLEKEYEKEMEEAKKPGEKGDTNIPPEDEDEYCPEKGGSAEDAERDAQAEEDARDKEADGADDDASDSEKNEKQKPTVFYTIEPVAPHRKVMKGDYCSGRKSYFDPATLNWSKKKQLTSYTGDLAVKAPRQKISGTCTNQITSLPIPNNYALDATSLEVESGSPRDIKIFRDQTGCFYVQGKNSVNFSIEFGKENPKYTHKLISEDRKKLNTTPLSQKTEDFMKNLSGTDFQKAEAIRKYIFDNHFYPGDGTNLKLAEAIQLRLRANARDASGRGDGDKYIHELDNSEYLECYSSNTLFVTLARQAGIPARIVVGHHADKARNGRVELTSDTGHAWAEIWDGTAWRRFDATPAPKPEALKKKKERDKKNKKKGKKNDDEPDGTESEKADDGGIESKNKREDPEEDGDQDSDQDGEESDGEGEESDGEAQDGKPKDGKPSDGKPKPGQKKPGQKPPTSDEVKQKVQEQLSEFEDSQDPEDMPEVGDKPLEDCEEDQSEAEEALEDAEQKRDELDKKISEAKDFNELKEAQKKLEREQDNVLEDDAKDLKEKLEAMEEALKEKKKQELEKMCEEGFIDEATKQKLMEQLENGDLNSLKDFGREIAGEEALYLEFDRLRSEVAPLVDQYYDYIAGILPKEEDLVIDADAAAISGKLNTRLLSKVENLYTGEVFNPRKFESEYKPRYLVMFMLDVSGSMDMYPPGVTNSGTKLQFATKFLVFMCELLSRISQKYGYIRFAISTFSDRINEIKGFDHKYETDEKYTFLDQIKGTVKAHMMKALRTSGGTRMLEGLEYSAAKLNREKEGYPDYCSALNFFGDGDDDGGRTAQIRALVNARGSYGLGEHMVKAFMLAPDSLKYVLADSFGEENTCTGTSFEEIALKWVEGFAADMEGYTDRLGIKKSH